MRISDWSSDVCSSDLLEHPESAGWRSGSIHTGKPETRSLNMEATTVAIVTGASRGLGQALALGLLQPGTRLMTVARSHDEALDAHAKASGCPLQQVQTDLANPADRKSTRLNSSH